jgi:hypothetical protein
MPQMILSMGLVRHLLCIKFDASKYSKMRGFSSIGVRRSHLAPTRRKAIASTSLLTQTSWRSLSLAGTADWGNQENE